MNIRWSKLARRGCRPRLCRFYSFHIFRLTLSGLSAVITLTIVSLRLPSSMANMPEPEKKESVPSDSSKVFELEDGEINSFLAAISLPPLALTPNSLSPFTSTIRRETRVDDCDQSTLLGNNAL